MWVGRGPRRGPGASLAPRRRCGASGRRPSGEAHPQQPVEGRQAAAAAEGALAVVQVKDLRPSSPIDGDDTAVDGGEPRAVLVDHAVVEALLVDEQALPGALDNGGVTLVGAGRPEADVPGNQVVGVDPSGASARGLGGPTAVMAVGTGPARVDWVAPRSYP